MKNKMRKIYDFRRAIVSMLCILLFLLCGVTATAQNREIGGTVLDETGQPAIGATVVVKGTNSMTITGLDGQFKLSVPKDAGQLEISYVGYETAKITLGRGKNVYNVKLKVADLAAMIDIEKEVAIENPLLLIVSVRSNGLSAHNFYCYMNNQLLEYKKMIDLRDLFHGLQNQMLASLNVNREFIEHPGSKGDATEQHWIEFLRTYLPDRYKVDKAIVIDSTGNVSEQMDIVIYDAIYTPFIFKQDGFMYIPAESVYAVFEVKQDVKGYIEYAAQKVESVRTLKRTSIGMVASGKTAAARPLTKIIGGILTTTSSYSGNDTVKVQLKKLKGLQTLDLGCLCDTGSFYVDYNETEPEGIAPTSSIEDNRKYIRQVYESREVKEVKFSDKDVSLFTFFLQLVNYLKFIGTVPAIDINAYLKAIHAKIDEDI
jgi:hypothetical protein